MTGGDDNDRLAGSADDDTLQGGRGADTLLGYAGDDFLYGALWATPLEDDASDRIHGGDGDDWIDGGAGNDVLRGDDGRDTLTGGDGADTLIGGGGADVLTGGALGDLIFGGAGADFINGGFGHDRLNGGAGADSFFHFGVAGHGTDWIQDYHAAEGDVLHFGGPASADQFVVTYAKTDGAGADGLAEAFVTYRPTGQILWVLVDGQGARDIMVKAQGVTFSLVPDRTVLIGGDGVDAFHGGPRLDILNFQQEAGPLGVTVNLNDVDEVVGKVVHAAQTASDTYGNRGEHVSGVEVVHGTLAGDVLIGSDADHLETFYTYGGSNYLDGGDGHSRYFLRGDLDGTIIRVGTSYTDRRDVVSIGFGNDAIPTTGDITVVGEGTSGSRFQHHLVFEGLNTGVTVNLGGTTGGAMDRAYGATWDGGSLDFSQAAHFLEVEGSQFADVLIGGNAAHDYLEWYHGNSGADTIHGGSGTDDCAVYEYEVGDGSGRGVTVHLDDGGATTGQDDASLEAAYGFDVYSNGYAIDCNGDTDTLVNIDNVRGSAGNDLLVGSGADNSFWGLAGNDTFDGAGGVDAVHYLSDLFFLEVGNPALVISGIEVDLFSGIASNDGYGGTDTLTSIENIFGSEYADLVAGNAADNRLRGYSGDDTLSGGWGNDTLIGDAGGDLMNGEGNDDVLIGLAGNDTLTGGVGGDTFVFFLGTGDDVITDFDPQRDWLRIASELAAGRSAEDLFATAEVSAQGLLIEFAGGSLLLEGLTRDDGAAIAEHMVFV